MVKKLNKYLLFLMTRGHLKSEPSNIIMFYQHIWCAWHSTCIINLHNSPAQEVGVIYPHFTDDETEAEGSLVTLSRSHAQ